MPGFDVAVVGSGVAGAFAAVELARRGRRVLLATVDGVLGGATVKASGVVTVQLTEPHLSWALRSAKEYLKAGVARRVRSVWVAPEQCIGEILEGLAGRGIQSGTLSSLEASRLAGTPIRPPQGLSLAYTEDVLVDVGSLSAFLAASMARLGVTVWTCTARRAGRDYVECDGTTVEAGEVVVAAGAWTPRVLGVRPEDIGASIYRCEASSVALQGLRAPVYVDLGSRVAAYAVPESGVSAIVGDGPNDLLREPEDAVPSPGSPYDVLEVLSAAMPAALEAYPRASWAAPCLISGDGYPLIGRPSRSSPLIFTGFNGYGLMVAPALAKVLASHIVDGAELPGEVRADRPLEPWRGRGRPPEPHRVCA